MYEKELEHAERLVEAACHVTRAVQDEIVGTGVGIGEILQFEDGVHRGRQYWCPMPM